VWKRCKK